MAEKRWEADSVEFLRTLAEDNSYGFYYMTRTKLRRTADELERLRAKLNEIRFTSKGYPNASREGRIADEALGGQNG